MKKIFTLFAVAAMALNSFAVINVTNDDTGFTMRLADESGQAEKTVQLILGIKLGTENLCDIFQCDVNIPEGAKVKAVKGIEMITDNLYDLNALEGTDYEGATVADLDGEGFVANKSAKDGTKKNSKPNVMFIIEHSLDCQALYIPGISTFAAGDYDIFKLNLDCSGLPDGTNWVEMETGPEFTMLNFKRGEASERFKGEAVINTPVTPFKVKLYKKDGVVSQIEAISANEVPAAQKGIYTMMGVKVNRAEPGQMYIIDGKKVIPTSVIER